MTIYTRPTTLPAWAESGDKVQPSSAEIQTGWPAASNTPPSRQRFNWIQNWLANGLRYFMQMGIPEWSADESYPINARVQYNGEVYRAVAANSNVTPGTDASKWLVGASATGVTPAQFDATTRLATMEAVQRALGNFSKVNTYTGNATLGASDVGAIASFGLSANATVTMPNPADFPAGSVISIFNNNGFTLTIAGSIGGPGSETNAIVGQGMKQFFRLGSYWVVFNGSWLSSLTTNGYQKLPSGLIIQWGSIPSIASGSNATVTLPITFPSAFLCVATQPGASANGTGSLVFGVQINSTATFIARNFYSQTNSGQYIAIGY